MCKDLTDFPEVVTCLSIPYTQMKTVWFLDTHPQTLDYKLPQAVTSVRETYGDHFHQ